MKTLKIDFCDYKADTYSYLNNWLEIAITPELEELTLDLFPRKAKYSFLCSLLSNGRGNSIQHLKLVWCAFSTTTTTELTSSPGWKLILVPVSQPGLAFRD